MIKSKTQPNRAIPALLAGLLAVGAIAAHASTDYGPATWNPLPDYYTSGNGHKFHVVHDMEGYYHSVKSVLQNQGLSVHYATNGKKDASSDAAPGEISQFVRDANYGIHARCWNTHSTGTEHEGFASNPAWFTEEQYQASAGITRHLANKFGWAKDRNHVVGHGAKSSSAWVSWADTGLGIDPTCNDHTDPGPYWDWSHYMDLVNGVVPPRLDVFARGNNNALYQQTWTSSGSWSGWINLGGTLTSDPSVVSRKADSLNVFIRSTDNALWTKSWDGSAWSGWSSLGGALTSSPDACSWGSDRLDVFIRSTDNALWQKTWTSSGSWGGWINLGGTLTSDPAAVSRKGNSINVFIRSSDNALWTKSWDGSAWSGWTSLGGSLGGGPDVCAWDANRLDVFARSSSNTLIHRTWTSAGGWSSWQDHGGALTSDPTAASRAANSINVYIRSTDNAIWTKSWDGSAWSGWSSLGGGIIGGPDACSWSNTTDTR